MLNIDKETAAKIIDALAVAIDGKPSSAKTFSASPFTGLADYGDWGQQNNDATQDTPRTIALFLSYLIFSGGRIPLIGIQMQDTWFRPDVWVVGALEKRGYLTVDESSGYFLVTSEGWSLVANALGELNG
ncbi:hypothetical protein FJ417_18630 [Mesorhizobium sp. B3-1-7]|uniref:hypothetical protein n=1 Tax=Mesorhizobium sp. B3-1-7 TaxID=2589894 RepID=UPI00112E119A|nr:hypothetical protein [Mesorhizobium sp. B3-1-7]TPI58640.1 hypothetical protein FJ417_18630 [Mesorhizobium sp. B3-1-7]